MHGILRNQEDHSDKQRRVGESDQNGPSNQLANPGTSEKRNQKVDRVAIWERVATKSPSLFDSIQIDLIDQDLNLIAEDAELLGLADSQVSQLQHDFREFYEAFRKVEFQYTQIRKDGLGKPVIVSHAIPERERDMLIGQLTGVFQRALPDPLANLIAGSLVAKNRVMFASLSGLDRIIFMKMTNDEVFRATGRGGRIGVVYLKSGSRPVDGVRIGTFEGGLYQIPGIQAGYVDSNDQIVEEIPQIYQHFYVEE